MTKNVIKLAIHLGNPGYILTVIAGTISESYFALAELTGVASLPPGEPRLSVAQRRDAFEKEVDEWLNK